MNDLKDQLDSQRLLYADDLHVYVQVPANQIEQGIVQLSDTAKIIASWAEMNCLPLNTKNHMQ